VGSMLFDVTLLERRSGACTLRNESTRTRKTGDGEGEI